MAKFEIKRSPNGQYFYHLRATGNNEIILRGTQYKTKTDCEKEIAEVKVYASFDRCYSKQTSLNGQYYFNLSNTGGVLGTSETYVTQKSRDIGIELVKAQAPTAPVIDLT